MVKRKSLPKKGDKAGYAARTSQRVTDSTSDSSESSSQSSNKSPESSSDEDETTKVKEQTNRSEKRKSTATTSKTSKSIITKPKNKSTALKDINRLQKTTNLLIPKAPFLRLIRELLMRRSDTAQGMRITEMAVEALREASENVLVSIFEDAYLLTLHAKRVTLFPRDMSLLLRLRNDFNLISNA